MSTGLVGIPRTFHRVPGFALLAIIVGAAACGDRSNPVFEQPGSGADWFPVEVTGVSVTPWVTAPASTGQRLSITIPGLSLDSAVIQPVDPVRAIVDGTPVSRWALYDDGTHGDSVAGDQVFTRSGLEPEGTGPIRSVTVSAVFFPGSAQPQRFVPTKFVLRSLDTTMIHPVEVTPLAPDVQVAPHVVVITGPEDEPVEEMKRVGDRYFELFPGDRDFLLVLHTGYAYSAAGVAVATSPAVQGIGLPSNVIYYRFPQGPNVLRAITFVSDPWRPWSSFEGRFCLPTHEIAHAWGAYLPRGLSAQGHWTGSFLRTRSAFGVDGKCEFNELELYLAGLLPADSVPSPLTQSGLTLADVIADVGTRQPPWPDAQRTFRAAFIASARAPLSPMDITYLETLANEYGLPESTLGLTFEAATGGRAVLDTRIPEPRATGPSIRRGG